jgi:hypothetical protein
VQAVTAGAGVSISPTGVLSLRADDPTFNGFIKTNNINAYNAYVWPSVNGSANQFLHNNGSGDLSWKSIAGFAVVVVSDDAPLVPDVGELWYDCTTGYLKVFQNCVTDFGWTKVAEPGLPLLPTNASATPSFSSGDGTQGNPYVCPATTVGVGATSAVVDDVTITGLAPFQYVPIVDLDANANDGRFTFTNFYANGAGVLEFKIIFTELPPSAPGTSYTANIRVGYSSVYIEASVTVISPVYLTSPGTISGSAFVNSLLTYTPGVASLGVPPYTYTWAWRRLDTGAVLQTGSGTTPQTYTIPPTLLGENLYVQETVVDNIGETDTLSTPPFPTPPNTIQEGQFPLTNINFPTTIPGTATTNWNELNPTTLTATGCILFSVNGGPFNQGPTPINNGDVLETQWWGDGSEIGLLCGSSPQGTTITGCIQDADYKQCGSITINRVPTLFPDLGTQSNLAVNSATTSLTVTPTGFNSPASVYLIGTSTTGINTQVSIDGGLYQPVPIVPTSGLVIDPGQTITVRTTTGSAHNTAYTATIGIGVATDYITSTFTATTSANQVFPNTIFSPPYAPNASPATVSILAQSLAGTANGTWADGSTSIQTTGSLQYSIGAGSFGSGSNPVINGNSVNLAWNPATVLASPAGAVLTGTLTNGVYTNTYNFTIDKTPNYNTPSQTGKPTSSTMTTGTFVPTGANSPCALTYTPGTPSLSVVQASINGGSLQLVPSSGSTLIVNPGDVIQLYGNTGASIGTTYSITTTLGSSPPVPWSVTTESAPTSVETPSITSPANNSTGVATTVTVAASPYVATGAAGTQASSAWQIYQNRPPLISTNTITGVSTGAGFTVFNPFPPGYIVYDLCYGQGCWLAIGKLPVPGVGNNPWWSTTLVLQSTDNGATWTDITTAAAAPFSAPSGAGPTSNGIVGCTYGNGYFVISYAPNPTGTGNSWPYSVSRNGANPATAWVGSTFGNNAYYSFPSSPAVAYGGGVWGMAQMPASGGAGQAQGGIFTSVNHGTNWTGAGGGKTSFVNIGALAAGNNVFIAVGGSGSNRPAMVMRTNGDQVTLPFTGPAFDVAFNGSSQWVTVGFNGGIAQSTNNGASWTAVSGTPFGTINMRTITYGDGIYMAGGDNGSVYTSTDGTSWTSVTSSFGAFGIYSSGYNPDDNVFMVGGANGQIAVSYSNGASTTTLTIAGCLTDGFILGDSVISNPAAATAGTIIALSNSSVTVSPGSGGWAVGQRIEMNPASYSVIANVTGDTVNLTSYPLTGLSSNTSFYSRVQYTSNPTVTSSAFSTWSEFTTA